MGKAQLDVVNSLIESLSFLALYVAILISTRSSWLKSYMQKTCDVAEMAILAKKKLRKKCVNRDKM